MRILKIMAILIGIALFSAGAGYYNAQASAWDKMTKVTFSESVQVPGAVLGAGTYVFRLNDSAANRHIVHIFNEDQTRALATILAIPNERPKPAEKTILTYAERPANEPVALSTWFYPGDSFGQQFVYPKSQAEELSRLNHVHVPSTGSDEGYAGYSEQTTAPVVSDRTEVAENRTPEPESTPVAESPQPATTAEPVPSYSATQAAPSEQETRLPQTASSLPIIALVGLVLLGVALTLRVALRA
jgi:outer membrane biosynthesis protein TonB